MSGTKNADLGSGTQDLWPTFTAEVGRIRPSSPSALTSATADDSLRSLVEQLVDERLAEADAERRELKKESRWMGVRVLTLEQTLKKSREENQALSDYLQICFDEIRSQDDRLSPRLAALEAETRALSSRASKVDVDAIELRQDTNEALSKIDALAAELFELIYDAKSLAVQASGNAEAVALQADELVVDLREAHEHVRLLDNRTQTISHELEETVEAAELIVSGLADAAEASTMAQAAAENARVHAEGVAGLSDELRDELERRTTALRKEIANKVGSVKNAGRDELDLELEEDVKNVMELAEEVRVLAEKAKARADYAADSSDEVRADLDLQAEELRQLDERSAALRSDLDKRTSALRNDLQKRTDALRVDVDEQTGELRGDLAERTERLRSDLDERTAELRDKINDRPVVEANDAAMHDLRSEVAASLDALKSRVDDRLNGYAISSLEAAMGSEDKPRKRWHAHLRHDGDDRESTFDGPKALPTET